MFDHKPTKREVDEAFSQFVTKAKRKQCEFTFQECAESYVESKSNVLSPSTLGEYTMKIKRLSEPFRALRVCDIRQHEIQMELNRIAAGRSPKTVADMNGFIQSILATFQTDYRKYRVTLPQKKKETLYIPTDDDIKRILAESENTMFALAIKLGCWGLRRSEICCITADDLDGCVLHINKALVQNKATREWIVKSTKTTESERDIIIPQDMADEIRSRGKAYDGFPGSISNWLRRTQDKLGIQHFSLHKERHYFATQLMQMGVAQKDIQKMGGWSTSRTLETIYQHDRIATDMERQQAISNALLGRLS